MGGKVGVIPKEYQKNPSFGMTLTQGIRNIRFRTKNNLTTHLRCHAGELGGRGWDWREGKKVSRD